MTRERAMEVERVVEVGGVVPRAVVHVDRRKEQLPRPRRAKAHRHRPLSEEARTRNRTKSKVRAKVEHAFLVIKRIFGWAKVRYRGLAKNTHWLQISCGLANLYMARRCLLAGV